MSPLVAVVFAVAADGDVCAPAPGFPAVTGRKVELKSVPVEVRPSPNRKHSPPTA